MSAPRLPIVLTLVAILIAMLAGGLLLVSPSGVLYAEDEFQPRTVIPRAFPPITEFPVATAEKANRELNDAELVLGVVVEGEARAYPINMLTGPQREILNDTLGGKAIAATW